MSVKKASRVQSDKVIGGAPITSLMFALSILSATPPRPASNGLMTSRKVLTAFIAHEGNTQKGHRGPLGNPCLADRAMAHGWQNSLILTRIH